MKNLAEKYDVFISYEGNTGEDCAKKVYHTLTKKGYNVFFDRKNMGAVPDWMVKVDGIIKDCRYFICILTADVSLSKNVLKEIMSAMKHEGKGLEFYVCRHEDLSEDKIRNVKGISEDIKGRLLDGSRIIFTTCEDLARKIANKLPRKEGVSAGGHGAQDYMDEIAEGTGIVRIFKSRREEGEELANAVKGQMEQSGEEEILMMGNALRDYFAQPAGIKLIESGLKGGARYRVILLNPLSPAAKQRAIVECGDDEKDDERYKTCSLFRDIRASTEEIMRLRNSAYKGKIMAMFSSLTPTIFMIKTELYTFVEQYHIGSLADAGIQRKERGRHVLCLGGYVPIFMVRNDSIFAKLMISHFNNVWESADDFENDFERVYEKIKEFDEDHVRYRGMQFIEEAARTARGLLANGWLGKEIDTFRKVWK